MFHDRLLGSFKYVATIKLFTVVKDWWPNGHP